MVRGCFQDQTTWTLERKGVGSAATNHSGPAGTSVRKQSEEHVPQPPSKARPSSPAPGLQPQLSTNHARTWSAPSTAVPRVQLLSSLKTVHLFFSCSSIPGDVNVDCTSPTSGSPRGLPCLSVGHSQHKKISFSLSPSKLEEFLTSVVSHVALKRELKKIT